jgi:hypothetical protein
MSLAVLVVAVVGAGVLLYAYLASEYTECFGSFGSPEAAEGATDEARDAGFDAFVERKSAVTFESPETGNDAGEFREIFHQILEREGGTFGHPGGGCLERQHFE